MKKSIFIILILALATFLIYLKTIDINSYKVNDKKNNDSLIFFNNKLDKISEKRLQLEKMALIERSKLRVMVEHDNSPKTNTYPVILDASRSYDPDLGDNIEFKWKQISGPTVSIMPGNNKPKVSFEGSPGEYTFELIVKDNYGAENKVIKTVIIEPEPNKSPVIEMEIRQGSELK